MESDLKIHYNLLLCPVISSWITIPISSLFIASISFVFGIPDIFLFIFSTIFAISFATNAALITLSYKKKKLKFYYYSYFISMIFVILSIIFLIGFLISSLIYIILHLKEINIFRMLINLSAILGPFVILFIMLLNIISFKKKMLRDTTPLTDSQIKENKVEIQSTTSIGEQKA